MRAPTETPGGRTGSAADRGRGEPADHDQHADLARAELALAGAVLVGTVAVGRLVDGGWTGPAPWPLAVTTVVGYGVVALGSRRLRVEAAATVTAVVAVLAVAVAAVATVLPRATWFGLPVARTPHRVDLALQGARPALSGWHWPVPAPSGVVLLAALVCGLAAVAARALAGSAGRTVDGSAGEPGPGRLARPAVGLTVPLVLVAASALAAPDAGAVLVSVVFVVAAGATLALADPATAGPDPGGRGRRAWASPRSAAAVVGAAVLVAVVVAVPFGTGNAHLGTGTGSGGGPAVTPTGLALASDLVGLERRDPKLVLFRARTPTPTYWQLATLPVWRDGGWVPDAATDAVLRHDRTVPPSGPAAAAPRGTFTAQVTMAALSSRLLPTPPAALAVQPAGRARLTTVGVVAPTAPGPGVRYAIVAAVAPSVADLGPSGRGSATPLSPPQLAAALVVPVDADRMQVLARQITAGAATPLEEAERLVDWFRSGRFRYTLDPPAVPAGADPLLRFLDTTRTGTCEAFASAFTVLARAAGLPTRVAIGFTGGTRGAGGTTTVRGADAHAWPQVYLAGGGWVSFEPTPQQPAGELSPPDVVGPTGVASPTTVPTTVPTTRPAPPSTPPGESVPTTLGGARPPTSVATTSTSPLTTPAVTTPGVASPGRAPDHRAWWWAGVALVAAVGALVVWRRRRARSAPPSAPATPDQRVVAAYLQASQAFAAGGWGRPAWQPPLAYARTVAARVQQLGPARATPAGDALQAATTELVALAELVERTRYGPTGASEPEAEQAEGAAHRIADSVGRPPVRELLARAPEGTGAAAVSPGP
jgi:transglutaminase-like putative cysteine protease